MFEESSSVYFKRQELFQLCIAKVRKSRATKASSSDSHRQLTAEFSREEFILPSPIADDYHRNIKVINTVAIIELFHLKNLAIEISRISVVPHRRQRREVIAPDDKKFYQ